MPVLRSRGKLPKTLAITAPPPSPRPPSLDPTTPAKSDARPASTSDSSEASPAIGVSSSPPAPPPRRSLRLSSSPLNPEIAANPVSADAISGTRKTKSRVSRLSVGVSKGESETKVEGGSYMNLRSGARITQRRIDASDTGFDKLGGNQQNGDTSVGKRKRGRPKGTTKAVQVEQDRDNEVSEMDLVSNGESTEVARVEDQSEIVKNLVDFHSNFTQNIREEKEREDKHLNLRSGSNDKGKEKLILEDNYIDLENYTETIKKLHRSSYEEKGKGKMVIEEEDSSSISVSISNSDSDSYVVITNKINNSVPTTNVKVEMTRRDAERNRAIELAPKFAFFKPNEESESDKDEDLIPDSNQEDWPGPFSTAMKIIEEREAKLRARESNSNSNLSKMDASSDVSISWTPSKNRKLGNLIKPAPSLKTLCMRVLLDNSDEIESLEGLPDGLKSKFVLMLCHYRKMNSHLLSQLLKGNPTEICVSDCSWATKREFEEIFGKYDHSKLQVVQLDLCGRCMPDYILCNTLAQSPNSLPSLTKLSLKGAYSLSDDGLNAIICSAPLLSSINLSQCSLLTSAGILNLADKLGLVLRELYIDDCPNIGAMEILNGLKKIEFLEVLSMAGINSVCDKFVLELIPVCGYNLRELCFAGCMKLTTTSIKIIGQICPQLSALDIRNLNRLNDLAMGHLANGCRAIQQLKLRHNNFSDEAIAAFVEASGAQLTELSLNNIDKVGHHTAIAISRRCSFNLRKLDLSFCRNLTDKAVGLIVDTCSSLKILKLFGCTQITDIFLNGHSNSSIRIVGLNGDILDKIDISDFF